MKVLVAEGNEDSRNLLVKQLQGYGHDVIAVANGAEALEKALKEKPDILVTDILMPHMDGFMLCYLWKQIEQLRHVPFIFYTSSYTADEDRQFALSLGANAFLSKTTDTERLVRVMVEAFEKAKSGILSSPEVAPVEPSRYFAEYSKRLSTMLDRKVAQLEREVAERKQAEEALRESEGKYRLLAENVTDIIWTMDMNLRFTYISPSLTRRHGYSVEEAMAIPIEENLTPASFEAVMKVFEEEMAIEKMEQKDLFRPRTVEAEQYRKDGSTVWSELEMAFLRDADVQAIGIVGVSRDITERKRAEEELKIKYDAIESSLSAIAISDMEGNLTYVNPSFLQMWGYVGDKDILGRPAIQFWQVEEQAAEIQKALLEKRDWFGELTARKVDDSTFNAQISASLLTDGEGNPKGIVASFVDITERKRAEDELRESGERYRTVFNTAPASIILIDSEGQMVDVSPYHINNIGRGEITKEDFVGKNIITHPTIVNAGLSEKYKRVLEGEPFDIKDVYFPTLLRGGDGYFNVRGMPLFQDEEVIGAVITHEDITERKRAEEALRESEERFRTLTEKASDGITIIDADGNVLYESPSVERILGYGPDDWVGKPAFETIHPDDVSEAIKAYQFIVDNPGEAATTVIRSRHKDGSWHWMECVGRNLLEDTRVNGVVINYRDITERKKAEEALSRSEEEKSLILSSLSELVAYQDKQLRVIWANKAAAESVGLSVEQLVGRHCYEIWSQRTEPCIGCPVTRALETGRTQEAEMTTPTDGRVWGIRGYPVKDESGDVIGVVEVTIEITERKRAEEERESAARRVEALYNITQAVNRSLELDELLNESLATVLDVMQADIGGIYLLDLQSGEFTLKAHIGVSEDAVGSIGLIKLKEKEIKRVLEWREPVLTPFSLSTGANATRIAAAIEKGGMRAHITVPIRSRGMPVGALLLADRRERQFRDDEVELLVGIGNEIAVGIENALLLQRTKELSLTDELTGLYNRRHLYHMLEPEMYRTLRKGRSFCLVMLDLDGFKEYNDRMGHASGDSVLQSFAQTVESSLRKSDTAFRYGGDEFIIILPETDANKARQIMDRIRARWLKLVEAKYAPLETPLGFSTGIAQFPENADTADGLVFLADSALYYAKKEGGRGGDILVSSLSAIPPEILGTATLDQVYALAATVDARDPYTYGHSARVADIAQKMGKATGLSEKELANLYAASLLHDVGKVGVPDAILTKPGALTAEEWVTIKKHSAEGARIVGYVRGLGALVPVIMHHHEWYDGTGYPDGLKGEEIPLAARIISVADAYDTMTTARPYREVVSYQEASEELRRCSGTQFDPEMVEAFYRAMDGDSGQGKKRKPASE